MAPKNKVVLPLNDVSEIDSLDRELLVSDRSEEKLRGFAS
jgi:hypothetical protein